MKKLFGGIDLTWKKIIIGAVVAGVFTALMALIKPLEFTSFSTITVSFEYWILIGIIIIMNSKSNLDSALKCFIFFLISQPLVYLIQVPFNAYGWGIFVYYRYWFLWTLFTLPMGYIGYYMKKGKWWGYVILLPMIYLLMQSYFLYLGDFMFYRPRYLLTVLYCAAMAIGLPIWLFEDKKIQRVGAAIGIVVIVAMTAMRFANPRYYHTSVFGNSEEHPFDSTSKAYFTDPSFGDVNIVYDEGLEDYLLDVTFKKGGKTTLVIEAADGSRQEYALDIKIDTYRYERIK